MQSIFFYSTQRMWCLCTNFNGYQNGIEQTIQYVPDEKSVLMEDNYVVIYPGSSISLIQNRQSRRKQKKKSMHCLFWNSLCSSGVGWERCSVSEPSGQICPLQLQVCPHCDKAHCLHHRCCQTAYTGGHHSHMLGNNIWRSEIQKRV